MNSQNEVAEELRTSHAILESSRAFYSIVVLYSILSFGYWMKFLITEGLQLQYPQKGLKIAQRPTFSRHVNKSKFFYFLAVSWLTFQGLSNMIHQNIYLVKIYRLYSVHLPEIRVILANTPVFVIGKSCLCGRGHVSHLKICSL